MPAANGGGRLGAAARRRVDAAGLWCLLGYAALAFLARQPGEPALPAFFLLVAWTGLPAFALYLYLRRRGEPLPRGRMFLWAAAFRLCGLAGGPFYEDDFYRYLWDGYRFAASGSPYGAPPEAFFADPGVPEALQRVLDGVGYPELPTIYAPTAQLVFLLGYLLQPGGVAALQAILIVFDLATVALLLRLAPAGNVMLYAWCPLVVKEIAFTAHPDGVGVCLLLAAVVLARERRWRGAAVCLGLAAGAKIFALVLAPLVLAGAKVRHWLLFGAASAALYAPFVLSGGAEFEALQVFAREWEFNAALFALFAAVSDRGAAKLALGLAYGAFWAWCFVRYLRSGPPRAVPRGDWLYGALLAASPVINPWYLLWLLPFAAVFPGVWAWTASAVVLLGYVTGLNLNDYALQPYQQPAWARLLEFGSILLALLYDLFRRRQNFRERPCDNAGKEKRS